MVGTVADNLPIPKETLFEGVKPFCRRKRLISTWGSFDGKRKVEES
jgi:hypothetical protein